MLNLTKTQKICIQYGFLLLFNMYDGLFSIDNARYYINTYDYEVS